MEIKKFVFVTLLVCSFTILYAQTDTTRHSEHGFALSGGINYSNCSFYEYAPSPMLYAILNDKVAGTYSSPAPGWQTEIDYLFKINSNYLLTEGLQYESLEYEDSYLAKDGVSIYQKSYLTTSIVNMPVYCYRYLNKGRFRVKIGAGVTAGISVYGVEYLPRPNEGTYYMSSVIPILSAGIKLSPEYKISDDFTVFAEATASASNGVTSGAVAFHFAETNITAGISFFPGKAN